MKLAEMPPWLQSMLCIAGLAAGVAVHLAWHPLRRHFSDAYQFLVAHRLPLAAAFVVLILNGAPEAALDLAHRNSAMWQVEMVPVLRVGAVDAAVLLHQAVPPMPLALLLPLWLVMLTVQLLRYPYRFQKERLRADQKAVLVSLSILSLVWSAVFVATRADGAAFMEPVMQPVTLLFSGVASALYQVWLARLVIQWAVPVGEGGTSAGSECMARWRSILWLGCFNALWSGYRDWIGPEAAWLPWSLLVEVLVVFAPLPVAVAARRGSLAQAGGLSLRMIVRGGLPLVAWFVTAMALLLLGRHAVETSTALGRVPAAVIHALVTGVLTMWLLPAAMLLLYRCGFPSQDQPP